MTADLGELTPPPAPIVSALPKALYSIADAAITGYEASRAVLAEPVDWAWQGVLASSHVAEFCGQTASGKSTFAFLFAAARANAGSEPVNLLGHLVTPMAPGKFALVINEENSARSAVAKLDAAIEMLKLDPRATWSRILLVSRAGVSARDTAAMERGAPDFGDVWGSMVRAAEAGLLGLVILDTRAKILRRFGPSKDEDSQAAASEELTLLCERAGCPIIVVSHLRKGGDGDLDDLSGSAQRAGGADVILMFRADRDEGRVRSSKVTFLKLRDDEGDGLPPVTFSIGRTDGRWRLSEDGTAASGDDRPAHERVADFLKKGGAQNKSSIKDACKLSGDTLERALSTLFSERRLKKCKREVRGKSVDFFELRASAADGLFDVAPGQATKARTEDDDGPL